ncbi:dihydrofolate reductase family protein [uncultured Aquimarina sp.]|uniref:dihydrofolate reductase family protein n=1 Tax=uncultured Aquimarina sp. TaxID=575652 RepID=UPI0026191E30|nr:dihydrofolate reductase family protein [uncultured Aquimarina sp.]
MKTQTPKVTIHMVSSLDGFIAKKDGNVSWMRSTDKYDKGITLTDEYISEFLKSIDCYVMGSKTYQHALELGWPYGDIPVFVLTNKNLITDKKNVKFYSGELEKIVNDKLKPNFKNIWMVGGSILTKEFIRKGLADKIVTTIMPVILGNGTLFFDYIGQEHLLHLEDVLAFDDGMVELCYEIKRE